MDIKVKMIELTNKYLLAKTEEEKNQINNQVIKLVEDNKEEFIKKGLI
tara:strand:+ start:43 stop:186 length:144 start_codon:yes stop_codon:yes gene_type:complete